MSVGYATVKARGRVVIPIDIRRKFGMDEGTRVAFLAEGGCLFIQPLTDVFIEEMKGIVAEQGLPTNVERRLDRTLR